jgi:ABC-type multidrug transport system ATPase subunit
VSNSGVRPFYYLTSCEATAAIDHSTDSMIQNSIRTELKGVTVITVAHRLKTIGDSDKVMVLDAGKLVEFDTPANLLKRQSGFFKSLVDQSGPGEREELYRMAGVDIGHPTKDAKDEGEHKHHSWFRH